MQHTDSVQTATCSNSQLLSAQFVGRERTRGRDEEPAALLLHELRSPLASIQNAVAVLRRCSQGDSLRERMHDLIERQVRQITLLTTNLYQIAAPGMDDVLMQWERIDLRSVVSRASETVAPEFAQRLNTLVVTLPESSTWVFGDESRLEQVFITCSPTRRSIRKRAGRLPSQCLSAMDTR